MNQPFVVAYGMGVDSTAMLVGLSGIGMRPDLILFADVGGEKDETYAYQAIMDQFAPQPRAGLEVKLDPQSDQGIPEPMCVSHAVDERVAYCRCASPPPNH